MKIKIIIIGSCMAFVVGLSSRMNAQGYKAFRSVLRSELQLTPFTIPDLHYEPGTVMLIQKRTEQIYRSRTMVFPTLKLLSPHSKIPTAAITKIKEISFDAKSEIGIVPGEFAGVVNLGLKGKSSYNFQIKDAEKHQIQVGELKTLIYALDVSKPAEKDLLETLLTDECVVVVISLHVKSMAFNFQRTNEIDATTQAEMEKAAANAKIKFTMLNKTQFVLESEEPLYYGFDIFYKNNAELKRLYESKMKEQELLKKMAENNQKQAIMDQDRTMLDQMTLDINSTQREIEKKKMLLARAPDPRDSTVSADDKKLMQEIKIQERQLAELGKRYESLSQEIASRPNYAKEKEAMRAQLEAIGKFKFEIELPKPDSTLLDKLYGI